MFQERSSSSVFWCQQFPLLNDGQQVNNIKWVLTVLENEIMFDIASSFSLNFDQTIENLEKEGPCAVKHGITWGKKINLNSEREVWVLLHDI